MHFRGRRGFRADAGLEEDSARCSATVSRLLTRPPDAAL